MEPIKADPDYESFNSALELNQEEEKREKVKKIKKILEDEYGKELKYRQDQIEHIELQICKVRKLLHLLRYVLIMSYYDKKELEYNGDEEASTSTIIDKQNRIHPAIKKLLGSNSQDFDSLNATRNKRTTKNRNHSNVDESPLKKKIKIVNVEKEQPQQVETVENESQSVNNSATDLTRNREKVKHRIVIGNISRWMPSMEDDSLTHKWMMYVRGPKESPDVSHIIEKVVFYLHPSYKPYDVIEVCDSPFHLSRRGWGEFGVRLKIYFKVTLNKPVEIVHDIKLDNNCSGKPTLGNETIVDLFLYEPKMNKIKNEIQITNDEIDDYKESEHDYCFGDVKKENFDDFNDIYYEHSYSLPISCEHLPKSKTESEIDHGHDDNSLIYGLDGYMNQSNTNNKQSQQQINRNCRTTVLEVKPPQQSLLATNFRGNYDLNKYKFVLPKNKFKNMGEVLPYMFKRLPLYTKLANDINYKRVYPFTANNLSEFINWNVGKRMNSEWSRARTIKKILINEQVFGSQNWNTKAILMYGRSHNYTPHHSYGLFKQQSNEKDLILSCYVSNAKHVDFNLHKSIKEEDVTVNVDSDTDVASPVKKTNVNFTDISEQKLEQQCMYIKQASLDCGIFLKSEMIDDGIVFNGAERMIYEAVKCLTDNLIRRALNYTICRNEFDANTSVISKEDVQVAINEREETKALQDFIHERRNIEFFS